MNQAHGAGSNSVRSESSTSITFAISYVRVSTKEQAERDGDPEGFSIPAQREANRRKAESLGSVIIDEFVDRGESARSSARPELQKMLAYVKAHPEISYVIVHKVDRLARNRMDDVEINLALQQSDVTLVSATENIDETPSGMLLHGIMSSIAEFYSRNLATEVTKGMNQKAMGGGTPGRAPLGYLNVRTTNADGREARTIALDPERADLIGWAFEAYATGDWSIVRLADELELRGLTNRPSPKFPARPVRTSHLYGILTHPYYKGEVVWRGARYPGRHPQLVDTATWNQVQSVLEAHAAAEKQRVHLHYLKSSVYCGDCGSRLVITNAKNRHGAVYPYFVCVGRHQKRTPCTRKAMLISVVEALIEDYYDQVQLAPELRAQIEAELLRDLSAARSETEAQERELHSQQQRLTHQQTKLLQAHYASAIPLDLLKSEQDRITAQLETIGNRLDASKTRFDEIERNLKTALDFASNCHAAYLRANDHTRRLLNQAFFEKLYIEEDGVRGYFAGPFKTLLGLAEGCETSDDSTQPRQREMSSSDHRSRSVVDSTEHHTSRHLVRRPRTTKPPHMGQKCGGLKQTSLVRPTGFEPVTS
ncbi:Site-specific DNA recombinase [Frankineae bacterium MT45]|nr:Site-specific DNA recombinase [Frankineae bacterium MT45]